MMDNRITYDGTEVVHLLTAGLDKLSPIRYDSKYKDLLGENVVEKLNQWENVIRRQKDEPLTIVVCGEFKRGKSSLINALLGEDIVTTDITTETITINKVCYGAHANEIVLEGGKRIRLSDEELKSEKLRELLKDAHGSNQLILKRPIEILQSATIIDTPGLGDSMSDYTEDVAQALQMADAVIYVFSIAYPLSTQEQYFIKTCILPQKYTDFILVGNYADMMESPEDMEHVRETVCKRIGDVIPDAQPVLVSALDERNRQLEQARPNPVMCACLEESFEKLRQKLATLLEDKRDFVIPDRVQRMIASMIADVKGETDAIEEGLKLNAQQAAEKAKENRQLKKDKQKEQQAIFDMIDKKTEVYRADAVEWIETVITLMEKDADTLLNKVSTDDIKRFYTLFCVETLQEAFNRCSEDYLSCVYDELAQISPELTKSFSFDCAALSPRFIFEVNNNTYTVGDKIAFAGSIVGSQLGTGFLSMVTDYIGGLKREKEINQKAPDYIASIKKQLSGLHSNVLPALSKEYKDVSNRAKEQILAYFDNEMAQMEAVAQQAVSVSARDEQTKEEIRQAIEYLNAVLAELAQQLDITSQA